MQQRNHPKTALVLDAHLKSALTTIRSLGEKGIPIVAGSPRKTAMGIHSNFVQGTVVYPSPVDSRAGFVDAILQQAERHGEPQVLYTFSDTSFLPLYLDQRCHEKLLGVWAEPRSVQTAFDKEEALKLAMKLGIEIPHTLFLARLEDLDAIDWERSLPLVIKPRRSVAWRGDSAALQTACYAQSPREARQLCEQILASTGELPHVQDFLFGEELGAEFLCDGGVVVASFSHRRIRSLSPAGGAAVVKEAIPEDYKQIGEYGRRLAACLRWTGPIMVEFKVDQRDQRAKLLEINGRFWGSLPLAVFSGVDFPWLYYLLATGQDVPEAHGYAQGVISRHWWGDFIHLAHVMFDRSFMRPLVYPPRLNALWNFVFPDRSMKSDIAAKNDFGPVIAEFADYISRLFQHVPSLGHERRFRSLNHSIASIPPQGNKL